MVDDPTLRRLVTGILVPGLAESTVPDWLAREVDAGLESVCWFAGGSLEAARTSFPDLLILADEEGGNVTRIEASTGSSFPGNAALGVLDDVGVTERVGAAIGEMCRRAGIDVALAPVVDVNSEPDNPVIGVRSFGDDSALVTRHGAAFVRGVQSRGVAACAKHYPGHGATRTDSHLELPVVDADRDTFFARDVAPFAAAVDVGVRCVLTAHITVPAVDDTPATMSATWMRHLRDNLGFTGVVVTDALDMHAISRVVGRSRGAVDALRAGVDLVCIGNPEYPERYDAAAVLEDCRRHILAALRDGKLGVDHLEQASERVAELRVWLAAARRGLGPDVSGDVARSLGREVAGKVVRATGSVRLAGPPHVFVEAHTDIASGPRMSPAVVAITAREPRTTASLVPSGAGRDAVANVGDGRPVVLVTDGRSGDALVRTVRDVHPDAVVVYTGPVSGADIDPPAVLALGRGGVNADVVVELLLGVDTSDGGVAG